MMLSKTWTQGGRTGALTIAVALFLGWGWARGQQPAAPPAPSVKVGDPAPDFTLPDPSNKPVKLSDFKGKKNVVLAFYSLAFTPGWTKEVKAYQVDIAKFENSDTQVLGISVDSPPTQKKFAQENNITFPLLSDLSHKVSKEYGILDDRGFARRTTFVVDKKGIVRNIEQGPAAIDPAGAQQACRRLHSQ